MAIVAQGTGGAEVVVVKLLSGEGPMRKCVCVLKNLF